MDTLIEHVLASDHAHEWRYLRGAATDLVALLPFLNRAAGGSRDSVWRLPKGRPVCVVEENPICESPFCFAGPALTIGFTESSKAAGEFESCLIGDDPVFSTIEWPADVLFAMLKAAHRSTTLAVANRILSAFQFDERAELEFEPWYRHLMADLHALLRADLLHVQLRSAADFWESRGDHWHWIADETIFAPPSLDAKSVNDLIRNGSVVCASLNAAGSQLPIGTTAVEWVAHLPFKGRLSGLGVLTIGSVHKVTLIPEEVGLLELLQRELTHHLDRTRNHLRMQRMATIDGLTNLFNHRFFRTQLRTEFQRALRYQKKMSLVMIDIDDFKGYNDRHGHLAGDRVLAEIAKVIRSTVRDIDFVARYGGEEFALILPEVDSSGGMVVAEKVRVAVGSQQFKMESGEDVGSITVSCGVTDNMNTINSNDLIRRADRALYWVKTHGRNLVRLADPLEES